MHYFSWGHMAWIVMAWLLAFGLFLTLIWSFVLSMSLRFEDRKSSGTMVKRDDASAGKDTDKYKVEEPELGKAA
jgi:hypothetical protein